MVWHISLKNSYVETTIYHNCKPCSIPLRQSALTNTILESVMTFSCNYLSPGYKPITESLFLCISRLVGRRRWMNVTSCLWQYFPWFKNTSWAQLVIISHSKKTWKSHWFAKQKQQMLTHNLTSLHYYYIKPGYQLPTNGTYESLLNCVYGWHRNKFG